MPIDLTVLDPGVPGWFEGMPPPSSTPTPGARGGLSSGWVLQLSSLFRDLQCPRQGWQPEKTTNMAPTSFNLLGISS